MAKKATKTEKVTRKLAKAKVAKGEQIVASPTVRISGLHFHNDEPAFKEWQKKTTGPIVIEMPCGRKKRFASAKRIPFVDVPCTCGNGTHYFVSIAR